MPDRRTGRHHDLHHDLHRDHRSPNQPNRRCWYAGRADRGTGAVDRDPTPAGHQSGVRCRNAVRHGDRRLGIGEEPWVESYFRNRVVRHDRDGHMAGKREEDRP